MISVNKIVSDYFYEKHNNYNFEDVGDQKWIYNWTSEVVKDMLSVYNEHKNEISKNDFNKLILSNVIFVFDWLSMTNEDRKYCYKEINDQIFKDTPNRDKVKMVSKLREEAQECNHFDAEDLLKSFNLPSYKIKLDKPIFVTFASIDREYDKYTLSTAIINEIDKSELKNTNSNLTIRLNNLTSESKHDIIDVLKDIAINNDLKLEELPIMDYLDTYCIGGNPLMNDYFLFEDKIVKEDSSCYLIKSGQDIILGNCLNIVNYLLSEEKHIKRHFEEKINELDTLFNRALDDKHKRKFIDNIINNIENKKYNMDSFDLIVPEDIKKRVNRKQDILKENSTEKNLDISM